jgi:nucleoside-diphosphate kinase
MSKNGLTLSIIKPDAVERNITGKIITKLEDAGLVVVAQKRMLLWLDFVQRFYSEHKERPFYEELCAFMISGPVVVQALTGQGFDVVAKNREVMGATDPAEAALGTIRREYGLSKGKNSVHGSDSAESAAREVSFFFSQGEIFL